MGAEALLRRRRKTFPPPKEILAAAMAPVGRSGSHFVSAALTGAGQLRIGL